MPKQNPEDPFFEHQTSFIIIPPGELLRSFRLIRGTLGKRVDADDRFSDKARDVSAFLNAWHQVAARLK